MTTQKNHHGISYRTLTQVKSALQKLPQNAEGRVKMARLIVRFGFVEPDALAYAESVAGIKRT